MKPDEIKYRNELMAVDDKSRIGEKDFCFLYWMLEELPLTASAHNRLIEIHERVFPDGSPE